MATQKEIGEFGFFVAVLFNLLALVVIFELIVEDTIAYKLLQQDGCIDFNGIIALADPYEGSQFKTAFMSFTDLLTRVVRKSTTTHKL